MPRTSCGLGTDEEGETADVGEPDGDEEAVSILPVLRVSCDSRVDVLLLCGVAIARERRREASPWMTCCTLGLGVETRMGTGWEWVGQGSKASLMHSQRTIMAPRLTGD